MPMPNISASHHGQQNQPFLYVIICILIAFGQPPRLGLKESNVSFHSHNNSKLDDLYNLFNRAIQIILSSHLMAM